MDACGGVCVIFVCVHACVCLYAYVYVWLLSKRFHLKSIWTHDMQAGLCGV